MCNFSHQDWCAEGWHVTKKDWRTICANLAAQRKQKRRSDDRTPGGATTEGDDRTPGDVTTEGAERSSPEAKRRRLNPDGIDLDDL